MPTTLPPGLTSDVQGAEEAGAAQPAALQLPDERQRRAQQAVEVLAAAQQHGARVGVQVLHCGTGTAHHRHLGGGGPFILGGRSFFLGVPFSPWGGVPFRGVPSIPGALSSQGSPPSSGAIPRGVPHSPWGSSSLPGVTPSPSGGLPEGIPAFPRGLSSRGSPSL